MERVTFLLTFMVCVSLSIATAINTGTNADADPAQGADADPAQGTSAGSASGTSAGSASGTNAGSVSEVVETASHEIPCKPILEDNTFIHGDYVYSFSENTATFKEAWRDCRSKGAELVTLADESERKLVGIDMQLQNVAQVWFGAKRLEPGNVFRTLVEGIEIEATRLADVDQEGTNCLSFNPSMSKYILSDCEENQKFVCKQQLACYSKLV